MDTADKLKKVVQDKYTLVVMQSQDGNCASGSSSECGVNEDYAQVEGYVADADFGLGCGLPTGIAQIKSGDTVLDLGSGAGNDVFVARAIVGERGKVIGVDMTEAMITRARANVAKLGFTNVEFRMGDIESLPVESDSVDVVVSNCVLNLVTDKRQAYAEIFRVLKAGGHFSISDIVAEGHLPESIRQSVEAYVGCIAGAMPKPDYLSIIEESGFTNIRVAKEKILSVADEMLNLLPEKEAEEFKASGNRLISITVYGDKP